MRNTVTILIVVMTLISFEAYAMKRCLISKTTIVNSMNSVGGVK